jgi:hypothetical protein
MSKMAKLASAEYKKLFSNTRCKYQVGIKTFLTRMSKVRYLKKIKQNELHKKIIPLMQKQPLLHDH